MGGERELCVCGFETGWRSDLATRETCQTRLQLDSKGEVSTSSYREGIETGALLQAQVDLGNVLLLEFGLGLNRVESGTAQGSDREERKNRSRSEGETARFVFRSVGKMSRKRC